MSAPKLVLVPTAGMLAGDQVVTQCAHCGTIVVVITRPVTTITGRRLPGVEALADLGPCPRCGRSEYWRQRFPVAGLKQAAAGG